LSPIRLIDENNQQLGIVETNVALARARDAGLDLVEVAPNERPPVCRIMDYGKFKYSASKKKHKSHEQKLKEVRMRLKTSEHDREIKVKKATKFLEAGDKVQFTLIFRGRERFHPELGQDIMKEIAQQLGELAKVERPPRSEGWRMIMIVAPAKK
jgi:translation initiation factor IF-3